MIYTTDYTLENYIINTKWQDLPENVKNRLKGCFIDLLGALISGSVSEQFKVGLSLAENLFGLGEVAVIGSNKKLSFIGSATAMGHSSNAFDIDDGHNETRAHHGTSFIGPILAISYEKNITLKEFLTALLVAYECSIRSGKAIMEYYNFAHSSGTFGAVGSVIGVGKVLGFTKEQLNNAISVAEFNAPLVPGIRSVEYPSMNKDGVPFGVMVGLLAIKETLFGFTGNKNLLESEEYKKYLLDLGKNYEVMNLYFKPYPCCRWAHPAIDACLSVMKKENISASNIKKVTIKTFKRATMLSKIKPTTSDEAQYNIAYPVASSIVYGDFTIDKIQKQALNDSKTLEMMDKLSFEVDDIIDSKFPTQRICRAEITTNDNKKYISQDCEPRGEAKENIDIKWLSDKFLRTTSFVLSKDNAKKILSLVTENENITIKNIVDEINKYIVKNA